jgi:hypothetical protein
MTVAPGMISRGKLHLIPKQIKDKKGFSRLFKKQLNQKKP